MSELIQFNIKNAKYSVVTESGGTRTYGSPVAFGNSDSLSLEANYSEKTIYGDGKIQRVLPNDKGKTGTLTLLTLNNAYEVAMKRRMATANGYAEIKQLSSVEHAVYFEFDYMEESTGAIKTAKAILYGVFSGRPSATYSQTTEDINNNNCDIPLTIKGVTLQNAAGTADYTDAAGNKISVWEEVCTPDDDNYATFGSSITDPKAAE